MTGRIQVDNIGNPAATVNLRTEYLHRRLIQRTNRWFKGGLWNPGNEFKEIPGSFLNFTPLYDDSYLLYTYMCPLGHRGAAHSITHWIFMAGGQEFARHTRAMDHQEAGSIHRWEVPSWGAGKSGSMGYFARQYADSNHSVHYNGRRYIDGSDSSRGVPAFVSIEEFLPAIDYVFAASGTSLGSQSNPAASAQILRNNGITQDGIYWIRPSGASRPHPHYCRFVGSDGWMMVYKKSSGYRNDPSDLWFSSGFNSDETNVLNLNKSGDYSSPFIEGFWTTIAPNRSRVEIRNEPSTVINHIEFNTSGTNNANWFAQAQINNSSFNGPATGSYNVFGIVGDVGNRRRWFMSRSYGGCNVDNGFMVLKGGEALTCNWDNYNYYQVLSVDNGAAAAAWDPSNNGNQSFRRDMMVVFVR
jgi:hypothetical protein